MTVDLDLLAEYVEGLLEPAEQGRVASLVHTDPDWSSAHEALRAALPSVTAALASATVEPMPPAVLTGTLAALAALAVERRDGGIPVRTPNRKPAGRDAARPDATAHNDTTRDAGTRHTAARDTTRPVAGRPSTAPRRRKRLGTALLGAFALLVVIVGGVGLLVHGSTTHGATASAGKMAVPQAATAQRPGLVIIASGRDYTGATLAGGFGGSVPGAATTPRASERAATDAAPEASAATPPGLARLVPTPALLACLAQVETEFGGTADQVDYASFMGTPALIVTLSDVNTVVAVGADCGQPGHGTDLLAHG